MARIKTRTDGGKSDGQHFLLSIYHNPTDTPSSNLCQKGGQRSIAICIHAGQKSVSSRVEWRRFSFTLTNSLSQSMFAAGISHILGKHYYYRRVWLCDYLSLATYSLIGLVGSHQTKLGLLFLLVIKPPTISSSCACSVAIS